MIDAELKTRFPWRFKKPDLHPSVVVCEGVRVFGDVKVGKESSLWFNSVMRGDVQAISIGERTNVQDLTVIHVTFKTGPTVIGNSVTIGHSALLHACTVGNEVLIGMGSQVLDGAIIGDCVLLGAGSLVTPNTKIPSGTKAFGRPAKVVGEISEKELEWIRFNAKHYVELAKTYKVK